MDIADAPWFPGLPLDGRLYDWKADPTESTPVENPAARQKLQKVLDSMARVKPPKFNRFESAGKAA